jgi:hypothetical protein
MAYTSLVQFTIIITCTVTFFFLREKLGFDLRASYMLAGALPLEPLHQPFFVMGFFQIGLPKLLAQGLALNCDPTDLCLLSSWGCRHEPLALLGLGLNISTVESVSFRYLENSKVQRRLETTGREKCK